MPRIGGFRRAALIRLAIALAVAVAAFGWATLGHSRPRAPARLRIGTASSGGAYSELGQGLAKILSQELPVTSCAAVNTAGSVENLRLLDDGELEFAFVQSDTGGSDDIRMVARLYDEVLHVVVNTRNFEKEPRTLSDLGGKVLGIGPKGSGTRYSVERLLEHYEVSFTDAYLEHEIPSASRALEVFEHGDIDALFILSGCPDANVKRLLKLDHATLISLDDSTAEDYDLEGYLGGTRGYQKADIVRGVYGLRQPPRDLETISVTALLVTRRDVDESLVREVARVLIDHKRDLADLHPAAKQIGEKTKLRVQPYIDHPAAAYYANTKPAPFSQLERPLVFVVAALALLVALVTAFREWRGARRHARVEHALHGAHAADDLHDVFIAYSTRAPEGAATVRAIAEELEGHGISCWYAPRNIEGGANWSEAIPNAIESTRRAFVLVFCEEANRSEHLARELTLASSAEVNIVPFFIEDVEPTGTMKYHTAHVQRVHGFRGQRAEGLGLLLQAIEKLGGAVREEAVDAASGASTAAGDAVAAGQAEDLDGRPQEPTTRRWPVLGALAVAGLVALWTWSPWDTAAVSEAPTLRAPAADARQIGGLLIYGWDFSGHDRNVEYEIERWVDGEERRLERVTARSWTESLSDLVGPIHWRVRALRPAPDESLKPTEWSPERTCTYYAHTLEKILATGRVVIAMSGDALNYLDGHDQSTNLELELVRIALQEALDRGGTGAPLHVDRVNFLWGDQLFGSLDSAECDLITASLSITNEREQSWHVRFTEPVTTFPPAFVHRPGQELCIMRGDGQGVCRIGVKVGTTHERLATRLAEGGKGVRVRSYAVENAYLAMYNDLIQGELELLLYDEPFARRVQESAKARHRELKLTPVDEAVMEDPPLERIGIATKRFDDALRTLLNEAIKKHKGEIERLNATLRRRRVF